MNASVPTQEQLYRGRWRYATITTGLVVRPHPLVARGWTFGGTQSGIIRLPDARLLGRGFQLILITESSALQDVQTADEGLLIDDFGSTYSACKLHLIDGNGLPGQWVVHPFTLMS